MFKAQSIFPMLSFIPYTAILLTILLRCTKIGAYAEMRIDNEPKYVKYKDIFKAFRAVQPNSSDFYWLYAFNYDSPYTRGKSCVYFLVEQLSSKGMNYSSHFFRNGTNGTYPYAGSFNSTPALDINGTNARDAYNSLHSDLRSVGSWPMVYNLIYSDHKNCSIFRIPSMQNAHGCILLVSKSQAYDGMPKACMNMYRNVCDKNRDRFHKIFNDTCEKP